MHSVEDAKRQADVDDGRPEGVTVKVHLHGIAEVRAGTEGRHDPQLLRERGASGACCDFCEHGRLGSQPSSLVAHQGLSPSADLQH